MSIPTYFGLGRDHFRRRGPSDCSKEATRIWGKSFTKFKNQSLIQEGVNELLKKGVIVECEHETVEYISPTFLREKTDGNQRLILNLKSLNKYLELSTLKCNHFRQF